MKMSCLATKMLLGVTVLLGCSGGGTSTAQTDASVKTEPFELVGSWLYLGPGDGPHTLKISGGLMAYADINGTWSSNWTTKDYDNRLHHFQVAFDSGNGTYLPVGQKMSGTYDLTGVILSVQLVNGLGSYPTLQSAGSCTDGSTPIPDCRIYVKQ